jgi:hypothetical protein
VVKNQEDFLKQMRRIHLALTKQRASFSLMNKIDSIDWGQLEPLNHVLELMNDTREIRVKQHETLMEQLEKYSDGETERYRQNLLGQESNLIEK